ncbi:MAG: hypothetical protein KIG50_07825 [Lachnospiraceae bacterium]|nr:hypothetical protein [Lachnospiraceae bacterium]
MKKRKKYFDGYLTVEAVFIIPSAVTIIVILMYWGFFCYDKCVSVQSAYLAALRGSNEWNMSGKDTEAFVKKNMDEAIKKTFLYTKNSETQVRIGFSDIETKIEGKMNILFSKLREDNTAYWEIGSTQKAYRLKPSSYIRRYRYSKGQASVLTGIASE